MILGRREEEEGKKRKEKGKEKWSVYLFCREAESG